MKLLFILLISLTLQAQNPINNSHLKGHKPEDFVAGPLLNCESSVVISSIRTMAYERINCFYEGAHVVFVDDKLGVRWFHPRVTDWKCVRVDDAPANIPKCKDSYEYRPLPLVALTDKHLRFNGPRVVTDTSTKRGKK